MMKLNLIFVILSGFLYAQNAQVGINIAQPDPSAILEISADPAPNSLVTTKKGFLLPKVTLLDDRDTTTVPAPAIGLLVHNTADNGIFPNEVRANTYYYWNGAKWVGIALYSFVEEAVKPRIFYLESSRTTTYSASQLNATVAPLPKIVVDYSETPVLNVANIITFDNINSTFKANFSGLYEVSAFVNYNPMNSTGNKRAFLNFIIQKSVNNGATWTDIIGTRTAWGVDAADYLKTVNLLSLPLQLNKNDLFRFVIMNPFVTSTGNDHGNNGSPYVGTSTHLPVSKGVKIQLLDFNL